MQDAYFDDAPTRASLLNFLTTQLTEPLRDRATGRLVSRDEVATWLAVLDTRAIAGCLRQSADRTADALAVAIRRRAAQLDPGEAIGDIIADHFPRLPYAERERLRLLTVALRQLAHDNDGTVLDRDLIARGFGMAEQRRLGAQAQEIAAILDGGAVWRESTAERPASERLRDIGARVAARRVGTAARAAAL